MLLVLQRFFGNCFFLLIKEMFVKRVSLEVELPNNWSWLMNENQMNRKNPISYSYKPYRPYGDYSVQYSKSKQSLTFCFIWGSNFESRNLKLEFQELDLSCTYNLCIHVKAWRYAINCQVTNFKIEKVTASLYHRSSHFANYCCKNRICSVANFSIFQ